MSKYMTFDSQAFPNRELLLEALAECGFATPTAGSNLSLDGWDKRNPQTADIVIRRRDVKGQALLGDIGFQKTAKGYVAIIRSYQARMIAARSLADFAAHAGKARCAAAMAA